MFNVLGLIFKVRISIQYLDIKVRVFNFDFESFNLGFNV